MKHGDVVYKLFRWHALISRRYITFRFRFDPVPGVCKTGRSYFRLWYKTPRTTNEIRQWYASEGYGRMKRSPLNLPDPWDDRRRADRYYDKSWKKTRKVYRQWQKNL